MGLSETVLLIFNAKIDLQASHALDSVFLLQVAGIMLLKCAITEFSRVFPEKQAELERTKASRLAKPISALLP